MRLLIVAMVLVATSAWAGGFDLSELTNRWHEESIGESQYIVLEPREVPNEPCLIPGCCVLHSPTRTIYEAKYFNDLDSIAEYLNQSHKTDSYRPEVYKVSPVDFRCDVKETKKKHTVEDVEREYKWKANP